MDCHNKNPSLFLHLIQFLHSHLQMDNEIVNEPNNQQIMDDIEVAEEIANLAINNADNGNRYLIFHGFMNFAFLIIASFFKIIMTRRCL